MEYDRCNTCGGPLAGLEESLRETCRTCDPDKTRNIPPSLEDILVDIMDSDLVEMLGRNELSIEGAWEIQANRLVGE